MGENDKAGVTTNKPTMRNENEAVMFIKVEKTNPKVM